jgi:hypothetical protein
MILLSSISGFYEIRDDPRKAWKNCPTRENTTPDEAVCEIWGRVCRMGRTVDRTGIPISLKNEHSNAVQGMVDRFCGKIIHIARKAELISDLDKLFSKTRKHWNSIQSISAYIPRCHLNISRELTSSPLVVVRTEEPGLGYCRLETD